MSKILFWRLFAVGAVFALSFFVGSWRFHAVDKQAPELESKVGEKISLSGEVVDEPDVRETNQKLVVELEEAKILVTTGFTDEYQYRDLIEFSGVLKKPENFITDQGKEFDYVNYLRKDGILYVMSYPRVKIISRNNGNYFKGWLFSLKESFMNKISKAIPNPESLLMGGLILGEKSSFDPSLRQDFVDTGTIHIVALSGYNVTIVADWLMKIFGFLSQSLRFGLGITTIWLFILMTGGVSTAIRSGIMATLALIARATGRTYGVGRGLVIAAVLMILMNPLILMYDVSFQLSFIATVAVVFLSPKLDKYFLWLTPKFGLLGIASTTSAAYIFVAPFILYKMGSISFIALPANLFILPFISPTMILGFATGILGFISSILSLLVGYISYFFLHYELGVVHFFAHLPFAASAISNFPLWATVLIYAYFIYRLFGKIMKKYLIELRENFAR